MPKAISQEYSARRVLYYISSFREIIEMNKDISYNNMLKFLSLEFNNLENEVRTEWL